MAKGGGSATKIVLGIVGGVALLAVACCVGGWFLIGEEGRSLFGEGIQMARRMSEGVQNFEEGFVDVFGEEARWEFGGGGDEALLLIGVPGEVAAEEVASLQDRAWKLYTTSFAGGGLPLSGVGVGVAGARTGGPGSHQGKVSGWAENVAAVESLVERTGIAAPTTVEFFETVQEWESRDGGEGVEVDVEARDGAVEVEVETR